MNDIVEIIREINAIGIGKFSKRVGMPEHILKRDKHDLRDYENVLTELKFYYKLVRALKKADKEGDEEKFKTLRTKYRDALSLRGLKNDLAGDVKKLKAVVALTEETIEAIKAGEVDEEIDEMFLEEDEEEDEEAGDGLGKQSRIERPKMSKEEKQKRTFLASETVAKRKFKKNATVKDMREALRKGV